MKINKKLDSLLGHIFGANKNAFSEVQIDKEVVEEILQIAREAYPNEFVALLQGKVRGGVLKVDGLIFLPGNTSDEGAVMQIFMLPLISDAVGSVHSHPGYSASPSTADLQFFAKNGFFHMIIAEPYDLDSIRAYDAFGNLVDYQII
ncbi:MAG: hypothetical protein FJ150_09920 [Euryarchaeota archaeon]|nr:hypothetical protein [Euryarchaeota archaeon]